VDEESSVSGQSKSSYLVNSGKKNNEEKEDQTRNDEDEFLDDGVDNQNCPEKRGKNKRYV
jgi:hypothetical protein